VSVPAKASAWLEFSAKETGAWIRVTPDRDATKATAFFHYRAEDKRATAAAPMFAGIATPADNSASAGLLFARGGDFKTLRFVPEGSAGETNCYDLDGDLKLRRVNDPAGAAWVRKNVPIAAPLITADAASMLYTDETGKRWRLPKGDKALDQRGELGNDRLCREVCTERNLLNVGGTFYELPAVNAGGFIKLRPIATHNRRIHDFASYRGLLVLSGIATDTKGDHIIRSDDGKCAVWAGAVDDLWKFGKPRGHGGPWVETSVKANVPSDAYLATGYDHKRLTLWHAGNAPVTFKIEADFSGTGVWTQVVSLSVKPGEKLEHTFPDAFGAYWLRVSASADTTATAQFEYF
jgi:hypothetical protein